MEDVATGHTQLISIDMGTYSKEVRVQPKGALGFGHCFDYAPQSWVIVHLESQTPIAAFPNGLSALQVWDHFAHENWGKLARLEAIDPELLERFDLWVEERLGVNCLAFLEAINDVCLRVIKPSPRLEDWML